MRKFASINLLLILLFVLLSCSSDSGSDTIDPTNLTVTVDVLSDGSGTIDVIAIADNAIRYELYPGENITESPISNTSGLFSYSYETTGVYLLAIRAYGSSGKYLLKESEVSVQVGNESCEPSNPTDGYKTPLCYPGMTLVFQDEFDGNSLNTSFWTHEIGTGNNGWGNNELQYYQEGNASVDNGYLIIEARKETVNNSNYTSSRIVTKDKKGIRFGRIDIRAKLPKGKGLWPALWMLGDNFNSVGWPNCGEIDIMELVGGETGDNTVHGTIHYDNGGHVYTGGDYTLNNGIFNDKFYVFTIIWDSASITWYVNDIQYHTENIASVDLEELTKSHFFIFNVAVGGDWPGSPDASTTFPQQMVVDYVRVFQPD